MDLEKMLTAHREKRQMFSAEKLQFDGVGELDVYNITAPFWQGEKLVIAGRVEARDSEQAQIIFFEKTPENTWRKINGTPELHLQDPFFTFIKDELVLGGVEVFFDQDKPQNTTWQTNFYRGSSLFTLEKFFSGPIGMKDIRLKELNENEVLVLTRPQGEKGGKGKIGYVMIHSLDELDRKKLQEAPLLTNQFSELAWGGANEIYVLEADRLGVLGHIACFDEEQMRHYYAMTFELKLPEFQIEHAQIIAERKDFLAGEAKRPDLEEVVFSGGLQQEEGKLFLYAGIGDTHGQKIQLKNPFNKKMKEGKNK